MRYKLRTIVSSNSTTKSMPKKVMGITIPNEIAVFFEGCHFTVERSGACIIAYSGASLNPTKSQVTKYKFGDVRI